MLAGKRVVITRARGQGGDLAAALEKLGAEVIEFPTIEIQPASDYGPLDEALGRIGSYDWIIFTSANGVRFFLGRLALAGLNIDAVQARICTIGPATRKEAENAGFKVALMPAEYVAESLVAAFEGHGLEGKRVLLPRAAVARDVVPAELRRRGATVDVVEAYRTGVPAEARAQAERIFDSGRRPDWITFTSSSTITNFIQVAGAAALESVRVATIGPVTSSTARQHGIEVTVEARTFTAAGVVEAILAAEDPT